MAALTTVKIYKGKSQEKAARQFSRDAEKMARDGWEVVAQSWEPGKTGCLRFLLTLTASAWIFKPAGSLTVTYKKPAPVPTLTPPVA